MNERFIEEVLSLLPKGPSSFPKEAINIALKTALDGKKVYVDTEAKKDLSNDEAMELFLASKSLEGCSNRTLKYYEATLKQALGKIGKNYLLIASSDIRGFLSDFQEKGTAGNTTIDNVRRVVSSFFSWLENEDYISKNPVRKIKKVKIGKKVKETYSDETIEILREHASCLRDIAIIDFLCSTGVRVGEVVKLNKADIDFEKRECIVTGKGNKQRKAYFDAVTKVHLQKYIQERTDGNEALLVSLLSPYKRLEISGIEIMLRKLGKECGLNKVHPHKFRRTLATKAIDKGMPIEQVQHLLGHSKIDTTLEYAMVDDTNVKLSHKKYLE